VPKCRGRAFFLENVKSFKFNVLKNNIKLFALGLKSINCVSLSFRCLASSNVSIQEKTTS
jgi:hypothetical protein